MGGQQALDGHTSTVSSAQGVGATAEVLSALESGCSLNPASSCMLLRELFLYPSVGRHSTRQRVWLVNGSPGTCRVGCYLDRS